MATPAKSTWLASVSFSPSSRCHWGPELAVTWHVTGWDILSAKCQAHPRGCCMGVCRDDAGKAPENDAETKIRFGAAMSASHGDCEGLHGGVHTSITPVLLHRLSGRRTGLGTITIITPAVLKQRCLWMYVGMGFGLIFLRKLVLLLAGWRPSPAYLGEVPMHTVFAHLELSLLPHSGQKG